MPGPTLRPGRQVGTDGWLACLEELQESAMVEGLPWLLPLAGTNRATAVSRQSYYARTQLRELSTLLKAGNIINNYYGPNITRDFGLYIERCSFCAKNYESCTSRLQVQDCFLHVRSNVQFQQGFAFLSRQNRSRNQLENRAERRRGTLEFDWSARTCCLVRGNFRTLFSSIRCIDKACFCMEISFSIFFFFIFLFENIILLFYRYVRILEF